MESYILYAGYTTVVHHLHQYSTLTLVENSIIYELTWPCTNALSDP